MQAPIQAVIFDMDGVVIDSEPLWRRAMIRGFTGVGMPFTEEDCRKTMGIRINEVVAYWLNYHGLRDIDPAALEEQIVSNLLELIDAEGKMIAGIAEILAFCREKGLKTGIGTSSSRRLMQAILNKLGLGNAFLALASAETMTYGKPHPEVFLACAAQLQVAPQHCFVIEDSLNGVIAAKAAQMQVVAVPDAAYRHVNKFNVADYCRQDMWEVLALFKALFT